MSDEQTMSDKLKPCPICGSESLSNDGLTIECECGCETCVHSWNTLPRQDSDDTVSITALANMAQSYGWENNETTLFDFIHDRFTSPRQELTEPEQRWLELAPKFNTDEFDHEYCSHRFLEDGESGWDFNAMVWSVSKDHSFKLIRRPKAPVWAVGDGFIRHGVPWAISVIHESFGELEAVCTMINLVTLEIDSECSYPPDPDREYKTKAELLQKAATRAQEV